MCPACGVTVPDAMFLCLLCADAAPDTLIVQIGAAIDAGDVSGAADAIHEAVVVLNGE